MNWHEHFEYRNGDLVRKHHPSRSEAWNKRYSGTVAGRLDSSGHIQVGASKKIHAAHRVVWEMHNGPIPAGLEIDHINGIRSDNRIENLRLATHAQNMRNQKLRSDNKSGVKGVFMRGSRWVARIRINGKYQYLGVFLEKEQAANAYAEASQRIHGQYGRVA